MSYKSQYNKLVVLAVIMLIPGCIWGSVQYDRSLGKEPINNIEPGKTTRENILKRFGPPAILAQKEGTVWLPSLDPTDEKMREVDSKVFFK